MLMRMGSVLRAGGTLVSPALTAIRNSGAGVNPRIADRRLAIAFSQLSHRAADGYFKPVYRELTPEYYENDFAATPSDIRIMHDIAVYHARKNMKLADGDPKYDALIFQHIVPLSDDQSPADARFLETVFGGRVIQELLGLHDLFPKNADTIQKLKAYIMALDPIYIDTVRYADMAAQPFINHVQRYIIEPNFYDPDDPFISLAVDIQNGSTPDRARLAAAKAADPQGLSQWGATLALGVRYYEAAQAYMDGDIDLGAFEEIALS